MNPYLRNLVDTLIQECQTSERLTKSSTAVNLELLSSIEKEALADEFLEWGWHVGSARTLGWLQQARILSATEYIAFKYEEDPEATQLIINDLMETEFRLLADLCQHFDCANATSIRIVEILTEALHQLCRDLCENPSLLQKDYIAALDSYLLADQLLHFKMLHVKIFLQNSQQGTLTEALTNLRTWNIEGDSNKAYASLLHSIFRENQNNAFVNILQMAKDANFKCWRFYLLFLKHLVSNDIAEEELNDLRAVAKGYVKAMFRKYLDEACDSVFHVLMLTVRQICANNENILGTYAIWYKATIGEMKYTLKTEEFNATMKTLTGMLEYENDSEILKIHINTSVPAPTFCNDIVLNYKQMCRSRLFFCTTATATDKCEAQHAEAMEVVVID